MPLRWKVFVTNAAVLVTATIVLAFSPATVSFPVAPTEIPVLAGGLAVMLVFNLLLVRHAFGPLSDLLTVMRGVDPLRPGDRAAVPDNDPEVAEITVAFNDMLRRLEDERRESARRALAAEEAERRRIARELHDEVGQALAAVVLQLDRLQQGSTGAERDEVVLAREAIRSSLEEVRDIAKRLRPEALDDLGLPSALAALTNDIGRRTGLRVERRLAELPDTLSAEEELVVYRMVQEGLTNAVRHGEARHAWVSFERAGDSPELVVRDDGHGFDPGRSRGGTGLRGMRERAVLIGAAVDVASEPGAGTTVRLRLRVPA